ncbi:MAG: PilW family protein [Acidobacteriota bacterium]
MTTVRTLSPREHGFTLIEMLVVVFLLAIAMLGLLAVFDASARINKSEQDVADAQGSVRFGIYQMTRTIRAAGAGGVYVTQAVLNHQPNGLPGYSGSASYDNVSSTKIKNLSDVDVPVRDGTDIIEIRGVINSPLVGFDEGHGCVGAIGASPAACVGSAMLLWTAPITGVLTKQHVNDDPANGRAQFSAIDLYTQSATGVNPFLVVVSFNDDLHPACGIMQNSYSVGQLDNPTTLVGTGTFGAAVKYGTALAQSFNGEDPGAAGVVAAGLKNVRRAGILDDIIYFIDDTDHLHPALAQATRRGDHFDVVRLADDVEDMQIAYGVDADDNGSIDRDTASINATTDTDENFSTAANKDEWRPNVPTETVNVATDFFVPGTPNAHCPRLQGVMVSLVAKSKDPDPTYRAEGSLGMVVMNTPVTAGIPDVAQYPTLSTEPHFRRRIQTIKINLRNY